MPPVEKMNIVVVGRVSQRTKVAFLRRAAREGKRPSAAFRELIEAYAHPVRPRNV